MAVVKDINKPPMAVIDTESASISGFKDDITPFVYSVAALCSLIFSVALATSLASF